ncbi:aromatic acid/H+ symport family MFS transporter [Gordonia sinesedis]
MIVALCWLFVVFDGYDLIVYGNVIPSLQDEWGISASTAGTIGSLAFLGMMIGAVLAGRLSDRIGRKRAIIGCAVVLSVFTALCAVAPGPEAFGALRFLAGLGLGGLVPTANALAAELVPDRWRSPIATLMMSGVPIGGSAAALLGIPVIPAWGWQPMFAFALIPLFVLVPLAWWLFPDRSADAATAADPGRNAPRGFGAVLGVEYRGVSVLFAVATVFTLLAWYGLGTWLPKLMQGNGVNLGGALTFALALNLGAVVGSVVTAWAATRFGALRTGVVAAVCAGIALLCLLASPSTGVTYAIVVIAGVGTHGTQCLVIAAVASFYPAALRGTALGWTLGVGRIGAVAAPQLGGWLIGAGLGASSNFVLFGASALAAAAALAAVSVGVARSRPRPVATPIAAGATG